MEVCPTCDRMRAMARPREFDEAEVLDAALKVFWAKGYEATSLADIEEATGLGRASLYAAFDDKEGLFTKVLERFDRRYDGLDAILASGPTVRAGFERLFDEWFKLNCTGDGPRGCLMQLAAQTGGGDLPKVKALIGEATARTEGSFRAALDRAKASGELPPGANTKMLARYVAVGMQGLSSAARAGLGKRDLRPIAARLVASTFADVDHAAAEAE